MKRDPDLENYLKEASNWEADKLQDALKKGDRWFKAIWMVTIQLSCA
jgi:type IV secretory pathway component VirB8